MSISELCPSYSSFFGFAGVAAAMSLSSIGSAYGTAVSGMGIAGIGQFKPELIMKSFIPVVMSGIIGIYGLVVSVLIIGNISPIENYSLFNGLIHLAAGLSVGMTGIASGYSIGIIGNSGVRSYMLQPRVFVSMVLVLIFSEVLGLYGLIVSLILNTKISHKC
ncbi:V-type proton ATPase proteolipid subunit 2 [Pneumocystis murina B123]|uniref:V-type proton ATPase proteolipid subunit n=1 Tax=Pneumocystis murina (strain B123) TaxID=1069680 RepID=M7NRY0_PNEMU|nr:V-type proton ATPase proteolipid subunit 2 [Pneumocystis murina B123]EMR10037.1 V-type proton ATPase proteolipid subunit 2 [Pneumocystis murina B123]